MRDRRRMGTPAYPAVNSIAEGLCYLSAPHVATPGGTLSGLELRNSEHELVGTVDGVLIDPPERRVRYLVVQRKPEDRVLLPIDEIVHVDFEGGTPRLQAPSGARLLEFDPHTVRPFSADDAVTSIFTRSN